MIYQCELFRHIYCDSNDHLQLLTCGFYCHVNGFRDGGVCVKQDRLPICKCLENSSTIDQSTQTGQESTETTTESSTASILETFESSSSTTTDDDQQTTSEETTQTSETTLELLSSTPFSTTTSMTPTPTLPLLTITKTSTTKRPRTTTTTTAPSTTTTTSTSSVDPTTAEAYYTEEETTSGPTSTTNTDPFESNWPISCRNYFCQAALHECVNVYKCLGRNCKACVYNHYNSCGPCADAVLDERVTLFALGSEHVLCEQEDIIHVYACSLYCRYHYYTDGICLLKDSLPICQCQT